MSIAWNDVWGQAVAAAVDAAEAKAPTAKTLIRRLADARAKRVKLLLVAWADDSLDDATLQGELDEERDILRMEFLAIKVLTKKAAQDAVNALFDVIENALLEGVEIAL